MNSSSRQVCFAHLAHHRKGRVEYVCQIVLDGLPQQEARAGPIECVILFQPTKHLCGCMLDGLVQRTGVANRKRTTDRRYLERRRYLCTRLRDSVKFDQGISPTCRPGRHPRHRKDRSAGSPSASLRCRWNPCRRHRRSLFQRYRHHRSGALVHENRCKCGNGLAGNGGLPLPGWFTFDPRPGGDA